MRCFARLEVVADLGGYDDDPPPDVNVRDRRVVSGTATEGEGSVWYVVHLLFAGEPEGEDKRALCESCQVLFQAESALAACDRGEAWAREHERESQSKLLGIEWVHRLDQAPADGVEVGGRFQDIDDPWGRRDQLIPPREELKAVLWETDTPIGEMMSDEQLERLSRYLDA